MEPHEDDTFEVEPQGNVDQVAGSHEVQTENLKHVIGSNTEHGNYSGIENTVMRLLLQLLQWRRYMHMSH